MIHDELNEPGVSIDIYPHEMFGWHAVAYVHGDRATSIQLRVELIAQDLLTRYDLKDD